jgi:hypothetical protein
MAGFFSRPLTVVVNDATVLSFNRFFGHNKECHEVHDDDIPSQNDADYKQPSERPPYGSLSAQVGHLSSPSLGVAQKVKMHRCCIVVDLWVVSRFSTVFRGFLALRP